MALVLTLALIISPPEVKAAQPFHADFLRVSAVYVTNLFAITNLSSPSSLGTNIAGTTFTNGSSRVVSTATVGQRLNLLTDVPLPVDSFGRALIITPTNAIVPGGSWSELTISTTMTAGSGANAAVSFVVVPMWDGVNEATETADTWTFAFTPTASATQNFSTNVPVYRFLGAEKLRLKRIVNADTDANGQVIVTDVTLNGWSN